MTTLQDRFNINSQLEHLQVGSPILVLFYSCLKQKFISTGSDVLYTAASKLHCIISNNALICLL